MKPLNDYIKHQPPMRFIDSLVEANNAKAHCQVIITTDHLYFRDYLDGLPAHVGIELMAQTIAAAAGYRHHEVGEPIKIGFLLGSRKYTCAVPVFKNNQCYDIYAEEIHAEPTGLSVFNCRIEHQNKVIAEARLNVFQPPDEDAFIKENYE
ncbi:3-hydroxymyristoyl-ACP dehydratase [Pseudidiomarina salinarum]|uniref:3-hydroxymyristoyl-ACP dehydratase n=1 Tax=Pseudidiomarina salinarum TaxID=435908 RepID=A0A094IYI9_9GAMM|nr:hotdog family protein [Pseudidiomarina salinarum]KFZ30849.1 3-hydroxymyristoyl-ACP dehydratase [Pseudidiomarina salinarum]RUO71321.1 hydroxymyristoyl-ACP dehydratase [Pseudidiomarina salinarum]